MTREWRRQEKHGHTSFFFPSSPRPLHIFPVPFSPAVFRSCYTGVAPSRPRVLPLLSLVRCSALDRSGDHFARNPPSRNTIDHSRCDATTRSCLGILSWNHGRRRRDSGFGIPHPSVPYEGLASHVEAAVFRFASVSAVRQSSVLD